MPPEEKNDRQEDQEVLGKILAGDRKAFGQLVVKYEVKVRSLARRLVGEAHEAEDLAQQAFLQAFRALDKFRGDAGFATWLYRITVNTCKMHLRKKKALLLEEGEEIPLAVDPSPGPLAEVDQGLLREKLEEALPRLPWPQRQAISLFYLQGMQLKEIAAILDAPIGTVKAWVSRGLVRLRGALKEERLG